MNQKSQDGWVIRGMAIILDEIIAETDFLEVTRPTPFHAPKRPNISVSNYLARISKYSGCSEECYVIALMYMDRLFEQHQDIVLNSYCVHRFLMTSILIAIKYQDDEFYKNEFYAKVGGIPVQELNDLELQFLKLIDFRVYVDYKNYEYYMDKLSKYIQSQDE